jgi:hypothetical protein
MRVLLKANIPVEAGNARALEGKLSETIQSILADLKPEAVYFSDNMGERTAYVFLEIEDSSHIPRIAEPWFLAFEAAVEIKAVMAPQDLEKAGPYIQAAVEKYG